MLLDIINELDFYALPSSLWALHVDPNNQFVVVNHLDANLTSNHQIEIDKQVYIHYSSQRQSIECTIFINQKIVPTAPIPSLKTILSSTSDLFNLIFKLEELRICPNAKIDDFCLFLINNRHSQNCSNCNSIVVAQSIETTHFQLVENTEIIENVLNETFNQDNTLKPQSPQLSAPLTPFLAQLIPEAQHHLEHELPQPQALEEQVSQLDLPQTQLTENDLNQLLDRSSQISDSKRINDLTAAQSVTLPQLPPLLMINKQPDPNTDTPNAKPFACTKCSKEFTREKFLQNHLLSHGRRTLCPICGITLASSSRLSRHLNIHQKSDEKALKLIRNLNEQINLVDSILSFECDICFEIFDDENGLKVHRSVMHETEEQYQKKLSCEICNKLFSSRQNLRTHLLSVHSSSRPYKCVICDKGFVYPRLLRNHMRIHTEEKPFSCPFCDKDLTTKEHLRTHLRIHTGSKPFSCAICSKTFTTIGNMKGHLRIHNIEDFR